jgi:putative ABC transport system substrate-binding protein
MNRREFIAGVGGAVAWPVAARAQQLRLPVVGYLNAISLEAVPLHSKKAFAEGLAAIGFVEGRDVVVEYRSADGHYDRLPALAADLVRHQVDVIVCGGGSTTALVAKAATRTLPLLVLSGGEPVKLGLVESLGRPGGNLTGVSQIVLGLDAKRLELLHELVGAAKIAHLVNPKNTITPQAIVDMTAAAKVLSVEVLTLRASDDVEIAAAFASAKHADIQGLIVGGDPFFVERRDAIVSLAARETVPTIYFFREFAEAGGLMSYGSNLTAAYRQLGVYAGRILQGAKPADLPMVEYADKIELVINLKAANALGVTIPPTILARADEVIE